MRTTGFLLLPFLLPSQDASPYGAIRREATPGGERIVVEPGLTLEEFIVQGSELLGRVVTWKTEAETLLESTRMRFSAPVRVEPEGFRDFFETTLLQQYDFVTIPPPGEKEGVYTVTYIKGGDRPFLKQRALMVPLGELPLYRGRGILVTTTIPLSHVDAQRLVTNLRNYFPDPQLESISTMGNSNSFLITGFAPTVARFCELIQSLDVPPPEFPQEGRLFLGPKQASGAPAPIPWEAEFANRLGEVSQILQVLVTQIEGLAAEVKALRK